MYNHYLSQSQQRPPEPYANFEEQEECCAKPSGGLLDGLKIGKIKFDTDTLVLFAIIWFILRENNDDGEIDTELLLVIGVLLFLGL